LSECLSVQDKFIKIDPDFLRTIATDSDRIPSLYYSKHGSVRRFFWMRLVLLYKLIRRLSNRDQICLDFGGGGGVFLPTLSNYFKQVVCVDLENDEAIEVMRKFSLKNTVIVNGDVSEVILDAAPFDAIVAADVLEHFQDLSIATNAIKKWLGKGGVLYTSLPTENCIYVLLRKVFKVEKPWDHYHTAEEVGSYLDQEGFRKIKGCYVPLYFNIFPLFRISAWQLK